MEELTPMLRQYFEQKEECPDALLLFRVGDFYETYGSDALLLAKALEITLTGRESGKQKIPMAGVPYHSLETHLATLIGKGFKVAISEQVEDLEDPRRVEDPRRTRQGVQDPKQAKGLLKRAIVRIMTSGTVIEPQLLNGKENQYLVSCVDNDNQIALAWADISTGEFKCNIFRKSNLENFFDELSILAPKEIIVPNEKTANFLKNYISLNPVPLVVKSNISTDIPSYLNSVDSFPYICQKAAALIVSYVMEVLRTSSISLEPLEFSGKSTHLILDRITIKNLELITGAEANGRDRSLLDILDQALTPMGSRLIRQWLERPLFLVEAIQERQECVKALYDNPLLLKNLREVFKGIGDVERLSGKVVYGSANARDLTALKTALSIVPKIVNILDMLSSSLITKIKGDIPDTKDLLNLIASSLIDSPPSNIKEGGIIREGFSKELDDLRKSSLEGKEWIAQMEERERTRSSIKSLKVGYNQVFGYYLEVTKSNIPLVPSHYIRKQTLVNGERYITDELKRYEGLVLGAEEKIRAIEYELFIDIREKVASHADKLRKLAQCIAQLDALGSFAYLAHQNGYACPIVDNSTIIKIYAGQHPVLARHLGTNFVPNDLLLDTDGNYLIILTGPNMGGKSTYLRQAALLVIMAQMGSFIPAKEARIGVVDRVFTRVGASDDLRSGQSTFMVEMNETAQILRHATIKSLIILDEVGRGTSTFDGLSIAWAVAEYLHNKERIGARTLFATHFHELTELEDVLPGVKNYRVAVKETGSLVTFLYHIEHGAQDKSYGIHVAKLADFPEEVLERARGLLKELEENECVIIESRRSKKKSISLNGCQGQLALFDFKRKLAHHAAN